MLCFFCFCYLKYHIIFYRIFRSIYLAERQLHMKKLSQVLLADTISRLRKEQSMTQQELAALLGIHRTTLTRILCRLKALNIIEKYTKNDLHILDMEALDRLARGDKR